VAPLAPDVARRGVINRANEPIQAKLRSTRGEGGAWNSKKVPKRSERMDGNTGSWNPIRWRRYCPPAVKRRRNTEESGAEKVDGPLGAGWSLVRENWSRTLDKYVENGEHRRFVKTVVR
jgi:hypothetical protein